MRHAQLEAVLDDGGRAHDARRLQPRIYDWVRPPPHPTTTTVSPAAPPSAPPAPAPHRTCSPHFSLASPISGPPPCSNYGVTTTSKIEWTFIADSKATPEQLGIPRWPVESEDKLPERDKCRRKPILSELKEKAKEYTPKLEAATQPPLVDEELIAANSYTGPVRVPLLRVAPAHILHVTSSPLIPRCVWPAHILQVTGVPFPAPTFSRDLRPLL